MRSSDDRASKILLETMLVDGSPDRCPNRIVRHDTIILDTDKGADALDVPPVT